jgi:hypothetical protein
MKRTDLKVEVAKAHYILIKYGEDMLSFEGRCREERERDKRAYKALCARREAAYRQELREKRIQCDTALSLLHVTVTKAGDPDPDYAKIFNLSKPPAAAAPLSKPPESARECYPEVVVEASADNSVRSTPTPFDGENLITSEMLSNGYIPIPIPSWVVEYSKRGSQRMQQPHHLDVTAFLSQQKQTG